MARIHFAIIALSAFLSNSLLSAVEARPISASLLPNQPLAPAGWLGVLLDSDAERPTVAEVIPGSPAESAGLRAGDVFLAVGGDKVSSIGDLQSLLGDAAVGREVVLQVERDGNKIEVEVRLGERPPEGSTPRASTGQSRADARKATPPKPAAVETRRLQREERQEPQRAATPRAYLGVSAVETDAGVRVERVVEDSPAAQGGLRAGDLLRAFDGRKIGDLEDLDRAMGRLRPGQKVRINITRGERSRDLNVELGESGEEGGDAANKVDEPDSKTIPVPVNVQKIGQSKPPAEGRQDPKARVSAPAKQDIKAEQQKTVEADMRRARAEMEKERASMQSEMERSRRDFERELERAQSDMNKERQSFEKEMQRARMQAEDELAHWRREMEKERKAMESELQKAQKESEQQMRRAHREMEEQRKQMDRELDRGRERAEKEMQRMQRDMEKERAGLEKDLQRSRSEADKEIARQAARVEDELKRARDTMDRERRRMNQPEPRRQAGSRQESGSALTSDLEKRLGGMRREFDRIRAELRELQTLLEKKRR